MSAPITVEAELAAMFTFALKNSKRVNVKTNCQRVDGEVFYEYCSLYVHSDSKKVQWTMGLKFLAQPATGKIRLETLSCFATP